MSTFEERTVTVPWHAGQNGFWWNETCIMVIEIFGLPGDRFRYSPTPDKMEFYFNTTEDAFLCKILLSDRITAVGL
jgi:hypothetical protein